jgi:hypothetical protein
MTIKRLLETYPRKRKKLESDYNKIYKKFYYDNLNKKNFVSSLIKKMETKLFHKPISLHKGKKILELGAGNLDHIQFENFNSYDAVEPEKKYYKDNKVALKKINKIYDSIFQIPNHKKYDKILALFTLDVIDDLPKFLAKIGKLMTKNSIFYVGNSTIGSLSFSLSWRLTSGLNFFLKYGKNLGVLKEHESVNKYDEIIELLKYFFEEIEIEMKPNFFFIFNTYCYIKLKKPILKRCNKFMK